MNILFPGSRIIYGGGEKVLNWLALNLIDEGHTVYFSTTCDNEEYLNKLKKVGLYGKVRVVRYPTVLKKKHPMSYLKQWRKIFRDNKIDIFLIFGGSLFEQWAALLENTKVVLSERVAPDTRPFLSRVLKKIQYRFADGYVFQTKEAASFYNKQAQKIGIVIPNPIIDKLPPPIPPNRKEIVSVGRLSPEKNYKLLVDAFTIFHRVHSDYKLTIYGSGPLKDRLLNQARSLGVADCFTIIEGKRDIVEQIKGAALFVLSSNCEGMPNALIEAMAMGIVCISTDCPVYGPRMLVKNGINAFLTPVKDSERMAKTMEEAIMCEQDKIIRESVKIRELLEPGRIFKYWIHYFMQVAGDVK